MEVTAFLSHLATECNVDSSTQNQSLSAILFFYSKVLFAGWRRRSGLPRGSSGKGLWGRRGNVADTRMPPDNLEIEET